ncbi:MAG: ABC transporter substrate-binding protein [Litorilinea sp.]|nr:MAG: ABC transporter substrate-binding protein [Litorilinea sp.]
MKDMDVLCTHRFLRRSSWVAALLLVVVLLAACAGSAAPGAPPAAEQSQTGSEAATAEPAAAPAAVGRADTLIFAADMSDLISLDPAVAYEFGGIQVVGNVYETLVSFEPGQPGIKPLLAESWDVEDSGDMWTLTFHLNPNATFASGRPVTAEDVVFSWSRAIDLNKSPAFLFIDVVKLTKENIRAVDEKTLEVKLPKDVSPQVFLSVISFSLAAVVDKAEVEAHMGDDMGSAWLNDHSAGSGPYVLEAWERSVQVTLNANPNYWGPAPKLPRVILQNVTELANLQAAIETGDADIVQDLGPEQAAALEGNPDVKLVKADSTLLVYIGMNATKPPLDKPEVREAIRYAINYDEIETLLKGGGRIVQEIIPAGFLGHTGQRFFDQDLDKARELLAQAGVAEGTEIEFLIPVGPAPGGLEWSTLAAKIQNDLQQVGLVLNIRQTQQSELLNIYRAQDAEMVLINWGPDFPDPDGNVTPFTNYEARSIAWRNDWNNPEIAELGKQAAIEADPEKRAELYRELVERVAHEGPYVVLYQPTRTYGLRSNITGFIYDPADTPGITFSIIGKE